MNKVVVQPPPDPNKIRKKSFAHHRCEIDIELIKNNRMWKTAKGLVHAGASSSIVLSYSFDDSELNSNIMPVNWIQ